MFEEKDCGKKISLSTYVWYVRETSEMCFDVAFCSIMQAIVNAACCATDHAAVAFGILKSNYIVLYKLSRTKNNVAFQLKNVGAKIKIGNKSLHSSPCKDKE